ncbi:MAG: serine--tRNA ligase [Nanoarchaeota archaeon]
MIDIKFLREHPDSVKENIKKKFQDDKQKHIDEVLKKDITWRKLKGEADTLRAERNKVSKEISELKKAGKSVEAAMKRAQKIPQSLEEIEAKSNALEEDIHKLLVKIPNMIHKNVPIGKDSKENVELKQIGKQPKFTFPVKSHVELGESLGLLDFTSSAQTSGNGFYYIQGDLALLNQALLRYALDNMINKGYVYVETPYMLHSAVINNVTDLHDQKNMIYKIQDEDLYLIGTSEHALIGRYIDSILKEKQLPLKQTSYSMCFRKEVGSHGIDEKGIYRTHQFNKIEMIVICRPEDSMKLFEEMKSITLQIFSSLGVPIRELAICSGDLGDLKHIQIDIEAWSPRKKEYFEVGSCSNLTNAQAKLLKIRADGKEGKYTPHTLNNTAIATSRAMVAILENYQQKDGTIKIPDVLVPYMHGKRTIEKQK